MCIFIKWSPSLTLRIHWGVVLNKKKASVRTLQAKLKLHNKNCNPIAFPQQMACMWSLCVVQVTSGLELQHHCFVPILTYLTSVQQITFVLRSSKFRIACFFTWCLEINVLSYDYTVLFWKSRTWIRALLFFLFSVYYHV